MNLWLKLTDIKNKRLFKCRIKINPYYFLQFFSFALAFFPLKILIQTRKLPLLLRRNPQNLFQLKFKKKTHVKFSYNTQSINSKQKVTLVARQKSVEDIFRILFSDLNIEYIAVEKQIVLKKKYVILPQLIEKKGKPKIYTISGFVKTEFDGEVLIGASISLQNSFPATMTNEYGFYSFSLPEGEYFLNYSYIGFKDTIVELNLNSDKNISQNLKIDASEIEIVVVTEDDNIDIFEKSPLKKIKLTNRMITSNVGLAGEADVVKSIQSVPGITSFGDGSVLFYVRGGSKDQNLIMIDDAPVYNPSHLFGFFLQLHRMP